MGMICSDDIYSTIVQGLVRLSTALYLELLDSFSQSSIITQKCTDLGYSQFRRIAYVIKVDESETDESETKPNEQAGTALTSHKSINRTLHIMHAREGG